MLGERLHEPAPAAPEGQDAGTRNLSTHYKGKYVSYVRATFTRKIQILPINVHH